jgi:hypothetical protein
MQLPHSSVRMRSQLSRPVVMPHSEPTFWQNAAVGEELQLHWLFPQLCGEGQVPQSTVREAPQLSVALTLPHSAAFAAQKVASSSDTHEH